MPGAARKIVVEFLGKDSGLSKEADRAASRTERLGGRMKKVGLIAAAGLGAGAIIAAKGLFDMGKQAAEDQVSTQLLARQLQKSAGATKGQIAQTENYITAQGKLLGVTDDELRPALGTLVAATHDVGKAQKLASLAMDISAARGLSLKTVTKALANGENGRVTGLAKLGIATKDAHGKTIDFETATKNLSDQFGGAAATKANTLQGRIQRLKVMFDETKESIGYKLLPVAEKLAAWFLNSGVPAISKFTTLMHDKLGPVVEGIRSLFSGSFGGANGDTKKNLAEIGASISSFVATVRSLWNTFGGTIMATTRAVFGAIKTIVGGQLQIVAGIFKTFSALLRGDWSGVWDGLKQIFSGFWAVIRGVVRLQWALVKGEFKAAGIALKAIWSGIWSGIKNVASAGVNGIVNSIKGVPGKIRAFAGLWKSAGSALIKGFVSGMKNAAGIISGIAGSVWSAIKSLLNGAIDKINSHLRISINKGPIHINFASHIPHLAKGGIVKGSSGGTLALIGEGGVGHDEVVAPLGRGGLGGVGGGDTYVFQISGALDVDAVGKQVEQILNRRRRTVGRKLEFAQ